MNNIINNDVNNESNNNIINFNYNITDLNDNNIILELLVKQRSNINNKMRLSYNDLKRISKYINNSIFCDDNCCIWNGYISTIKNNKHNYINFFFNKKKYSLQRLLYINYIGELKNNEYIKYNCNNKGCCCNINHIYKVNDKNKLNNNELITTSSNELENIIVNFN